MACETVPFIAQLEPDALIDAFIAEPPEGFTVERGPGGMPAFRAPFDLMTTADDALQRRIARLPGHRHWRRLITWPTRFAGATVTEYAPLPNAVAPGDLARDLKRRYARECRLFIVKDLADRSPLLDAEANAYAAGLAAALAAEGFVLLEGQALAWVPIDFASEDDYLAKQSYSRRKNIRRKLRARAGLEIEAVAAGDARFRDDATLGGFYRLLDAVYRQSDIHFDRLLPAFLRRVLQDATSHGVVFIYRHAGEMIGWNLCYEYAGKLVDKYIGLAYPAAHEHNLYFVSWMHNLEYARTRGLSHYVAGWTDPEVKVFLGAHLTLTRHAVYARNPLVRGALRRLAGHFEADSRKQEAMHGSD